MSPSQQNKGRDILRKILVDYRDRQSSGRNKIYQMGTEYSPIDPAVTSLFVNANSRVDATIKLYDHFESAKLRVDNYNDVYGSHEDIINDPKLSADQIAEKLVDEMFDGQGLWLFESTMPTIIG